MSAPAVYAAINAITAELATSGIEKRHRNEAEDYAYRSIDDVLDKLAPLIATNRLCILPRAIKRKVSERFDEQGRALIHVTLKVVFSLVSVEDGSHHNVEAFGEALDGSDKATAKAMSAAYKSAMIQTFCIPVGNGPDADASTYRLGSRQHQAEPIQGWTQWCEDIISIVEVCESDAAIDTVQQRNRELLKALSREQPQLYAELGARFTTRREQLRIPAKPPTRPRACRQAKARKELAHA